MSRLRHKSRADWWFARGTRISNFIMTFTFVNVASSMLNYVLTGITVDGRHLTLSEMIVAQMYLAMGFALVFVVIPAIIYFAHRFSKFSRYKRHLMFEFLKSSTHTQKRLDPWLQERAVGAKPKSSSARTTTKGSRRSSRVHG